ncbi:MAG: MFS transporter [Opitutales bacterium]
MPATEKPAPEPGRGSRPPIPDAVRRDFKRNYAAHSVEGGLFIGALAFISPETILPPFLEDLGAPSLLIAAMPILFWLGFVVPPLFVNHRIERLDRYKPWVVFWAWFQRVPLVIPATLLLFADALPNWVLLATIPTMMFFLGMAGGVTIPAWSALIAKVIPAHRRASAQAIRQALGATLGIGAGSVADWVLSEVQGPSAYSILFFTSVLIFLVGLGVFSLIREPDLPQTKRPPQDLRESLREFVRMVRGDRRLLNYLLSRGFILGLFILVPFLSIHAIETLNEDRAYSGLLTSFQSLGILLGNLAAGFIGDRFGGKVIMVIALNALILLTLLTLVASQEWVFLLIFILWGAGFSLQNVGHQTLQLEIAPPDRIAAYVSVQMAATVPFMLVAPLLSTGLRYLSTEYLEQAIWPLALPALISLVVALMFLLPVSDPRRERTCG